MPTSSPSDRIEQALSTQEPLSALRTVAQELRDEGMAREELFALFDGIRARHAADVDQTSYDAILDVLDFITGWCSPGKSLYQ